MKQYLTFLSRCFRLSFVGDGRYYAWMFTLSVIILFGINAYCKQFVNGLGVTGMTDQVSWGFYIFGLILIIKRTRFEFIIIIIERTWFEFLIVEGAWNNFFLQENT